MEWNEVKLGMEVEVESTPQYAWDRPTAKSKGVIRALNSYGGPSGTRLIDLISSKGYITSIYARLENIVPVTDARKEILDQPRTWCGTNNQEIGCDPEVFLVGEKRELIPAFHLLPPKKPGISCFWDGFQAEFRPLQQTCMAFETDNIQKGLMSVLNVARKANPEARLTIKNAFRLPLATRREGLPEHVELGCEPSFNVYGMPSPILGKDPRKIPWRAAGGHIHFGFQAFWKAALVDEEILGCTVKHLDAVLGIIGVSMAGNLDNPIRRRYYGCAGEYRLPKHGLEYRVLSNFWLCHPAICHIVLEIARAVMTSGMLGLPFKWTTKEEEVRRIINQHDVVAARAELKKNKASVEEVLKCCFKGGSPSLAPLARTQALKPIFEGAESVVAEPDNLEKNWLMKPKDWIQHSNGANACWGNASRTISQGQQI